MARPTKYKDEFCDRAIELGKKGYSWTGIACELDVHRDTLYEWKEVYKEFSYALMRARQEAQAWYEVQGRAGIWAGSNFNATTWAKQVSCRFPDDYTDKAKVDVVKTVAISEEDKAILKRVGVKVD